nr:hypothetical protein [Trabulsiella guamensis]
MIKFVVFCTPRDSAVGLYQRQRQAAVVAVIQVSFTQRHMFLLHLNLNLLHW